MADQEQKAIQYIAEAEKKLKSAKGFLSSFFGGGSKQEEACELYVKAANAFKMAKKWPQAGQAFEEAAKIQLTILQSKHEAATHYVEAGNCYRKGDAPAAINALHKAIEIYTDMGRFSMAAKHHITVAEIYETEQADIDLAMQNYQQAADYYKGEESNSSANKCLLKVAQFAATLENYMKATEIYEEVASKAIESSLLKYSAKEYYFKAAICHMCVDIPNCTLAIEKYKDMFPAFGDAREYKLIKTLLAAVEEDNVEQFTEALKEYDSISRLDPFLTKLLLNVKKQLNAEPELC